MESSECNWVYISKTICPGMLNLASRPFRCCSFIIPRKIHFDFFLMASHFLLVAVSDPVIHSLNITPLIEMRL